MYQGYIVYCIVSKTFDQIEDSVDGVTLSLDPDYVFVDGNIVSNMVLLVLYIALFLFEYQSLIGSRCKFYIIDL